MTKVADITANSSIPFIPNTDWLWGDVVGTKNGAIDQLRLKFRDARNRIILPFDPDLITCYINFGHLQNTVITV